jgi:DNA-binding NtrC family response regulator
MCYVSNARNELEELTVDDCLFRDLILFGQWRNMEQQRILIVEDELHNVLILCQALLHPMAGDFNVEVCPLADIALKRLRYERFDLIITDLRMPGTSGLELIRHVRQTSPGTRTMLITAFGSPEIEDQVRHLGAAYLRKPFGLQDFISAVQDVLADEGSDERQGHGIEREGLEIAIC